MTGILWGTGEFVECAAPYDFWQKGDSYVFGHINSPIGGGVSSFSIVQPGSYFTLSAAVAAAEKHFDYLLTFKPEYDATPLDVLAEKPPKRYKALSVDPPWSYKVWSKDTGQGRSAEAHYPTMSLTELMALDVPALMDDDCAVFMWVTWPTILDAFALAQAWGLTYKTCAFLFLKTNRKAWERQTMLSDPSNWFTGMGYWTRSNTEPCLLFTKGHPKRKSKSVKQALVAPIQKHSQKPDAQYARIEALVEGPYCELFARRKDRPGWDFWGNEVDSDVQVESKELVGK